MVLGGVGATKGGEEQGDFLKLMRLIRSRVEVRNTGTIRGD